MMADMKSISASIVVASGAACIIAAATSWVPPAFFNLQNLLMLVGLFTAAVGLWEWRKEMNSRSNSEAPADDRSDTDRVP
jgi:hypothetical protein